MRSISRTEVLVWCDQGLRQIIVKQKRICLTYSSYKYPHKELFSFFSIKKVTSPGDRESCKAKLQNYKISHLPVYLCSKACCELLRIMLIVVYTSVHDLPVLSANTWVTRQMTSSARRFSQSHSKLCGRWNVHHLSVSSRKRPKVDEALIALVTRRCVVRAGTWHLSNLLRYLVPF